MTGHSIDLKSIRAFGMQSYCIIGSPDAINTWKPSLTKSQLAPDWAPAITVCAQYCANASQLVQDLKGYGLSDIVVVGGPAPAGPQRPTASASNVLWTGRMDEDAMYVEDVAANTTWYIIEWDEYTARSRWLLKGLGHEDSVHDLSVLQAYFGVHQLEQRNLFVVDDPQMASWLHECFPQHSRLIVSSETATSFAIRLGRREGRYYLKPWRKCNKGLLYRRGLYERVPGYERTWSVAVYAWDRQLHEADMLFEFAESLGDRLMALAQMTDEISDLTFENPHNDHQWEITNKLNYYYVLLTGIMENLAWIIRIRWHLPIDNPHDMVLRYKERGRKPGKLLLALREISIELFNHIKEAQPFMEAVYPVRDSVQHRFVLKGAKFESLDEEWARTLVFLDPDTCRALHLLSPTQVQQSSEWGLFPLDENDAVLDPRVFVTKALHHTEQFVNRFLEILQVEEWLASDSEALMLATVPLTAPTYDR